MNKAFVKSAGDMSVGLYPTTATVELGIDFNDVSDDGSETREFIRSKLLELYNELWDEGRLAVQFDDECGDCGFVMRRKKKHNIAGITDILYECKNESCIRQYHGY